MVEKYGRQVKDLKSMYELRLPLKKRAADYERTIGEEAAPKKLHEILRNVVDHDTKLTATRQGVHTKSYKALTEHIDKDARSHPGTWTHRRNRITRCAFSRRLT